MLLLLLILFLCLNYFKTFNSLTMSFYFLDHDDDDDICFCFHFMNVFFRIKIIKKYLIIN